MKYEMHSMTGIIRRSKKMKIKYFKDTDTALFEFTDNQVKETREISENIYILTLMLMVTL